MTHGRKRWPFTIKMGWSPYQPGKAAGNYAQMTAALFSILTAVGECALRENLLVDAISVREDASEMGMLHQFCWAPLQL